jgi:hypothetical protein
MLDESVDQGGVVCGTMRKQEKPDWLQPIPQLLDLEGAEGGAGDSIVAS